MDSLHIHPHTGSFSYQSELNFRPLSASRTPVLLLDHLEPRHDQVSVIIKDTGGAARAVGEFIELKRVVASMNPALAVAAVRPCPTPDDASLETIRLLKRHGFRVITYADGASKWSVGAKCLPLLAGAAELLDSEEPTFADKLRRRLEEELRLHAGQQREDENIRTQMQRFGVVGQSAEMLGVFRSVIRFSMLSDLPVLLTGETGTGKELLARAIYNLDPKRNAHPFVALNCGAISPALAESEFFGHRRGAFTGAERDRKGLVRSADGGVLFLDEIGELEPALQGKLLRVLQDNRVLGVGEELEVPVNVRFIAATNRNLDQMVTEGKFRSDLFHRLCVLPIHIPPLRERPGDLTQLVQHFVQKHHTVRTSTPPGVSPDFVAALQHLELPGNARQVENLVRQALISEHQGGELALKNLPMEVLHQLTGREEGSTEASPSSTPGPGNAGQPTAREMNELVKRILDDQGWNLSGSVQECERLMFEAALQRTHRNQSQTARLLGITARSVYSKLRKYHLHG